MDRRQRPRDAGTNGAEGAWILVAIDFSEAAREAFRWARRLARDREAQLKALHVVDVHDLAEIAGAAGVPEAQLRRKIAEERKGRLDAFLDDVEREGSGGSAERAIVWGTPFEEIVREAIACEAVLIVMGTRGRSADLERALFGSTAEKVLRSAPCPILCVPADV